MREYRGCQISTQPTWTMNCLIEATVFQNGERLSMPYNMVGKTHQEAEQLAMRAIDGCTR